MFDGIIEFVMRVDAGGCTADNVEVRLGAVGCDPVDLVWDADGVEKV